ncbi:MAG: FAD-dependent oxidoreductase [Alphaproteobacteria bacterium]|nr:FAD-dependent oxidoreductase [Alphaproteobacteria bacterium]
MSAGRRIVIVGAAQAGARCAEALRAEGFAGRIVLVGDEKHLPYERPALSKAVLLGEAAPESTEVHPRAFYDEKSIELRLGVRAEAIATSAQRVLLSDGAWLTYDRLVLCTGSRARPLAGAPDLPGVHTLRTLDDCAALARALAPGARLVVIGGGFIGLEVASSAVKRGLAVAVVERQDSLLERVVPRAVAAQVERLHRLNGVDLHLGRGAQRILGQDRVTGVELQDGSVLPADLVVIGIGIVPNTELGEAAGARSEDGLVVDEYGRTTLANVWAAGDVTSHPNPILGRRVRLESWQNAQNQAIAVARNLVGQERRYAEVPWFWSDQFDANIQMYGLAGPGDAVAWRGDPAGGKAIGFAFAGGRLVFAVGFNMGGELRLARRLIETGAEVDAAALCDPARKLKDIVSAAAASAVAPAA